MWVGAPGCVGCSTQSPAFDCSTAPDCTETNYPMSVSYGSGNISGTMINTMLMTEQPNVTVSMISVTQATGDFSKFPFNGIIGLGPKSKFLQDLM